MKTARLMHTPEDLKKLGLTPGIVQQWEDGRRNSVAANHNEVWYFDAQFEDGTKIIVGFRPKMVRDYGENKSSPNINITITSPDGKHHADFLEYTDKESAFSDEKCDVKIGPHSVTGDLKDYQVKFEPGKKGIGANLHYECLVKPYRAGDTAYIALGENEEFFYTDMSIPKSF